MDFIGILSGSGSGIGKVALRIEFPDNEEMFRYLDTNKQLQQFVKPPNSKNPRDPETQSKLQKIVATAKAQPAPTLPAAADLETDSGVVLIPIDQIFTDHKNFQNRESSFSSDSVSRILQAISDGSFRWSMFDPITVWPDPSDGDKYKILSGHSRTEAFNQAFAAGLTADGKDFSRIPAKIFRGSLEEARELARTSNNLSTKETEVERAIYYREKRMAGTSQKDIRELAAKYEGKNAGFIINLSFLNPTGKTWDSLRILSAGTESENSRTIKEIADWIGEARRKFPDLTNGHENEIFDWLFSGAFSRIKGKRDFFDRLGMAIQRATQFGVMDERLNIENRSGKTATELEFDEKVEKARAEYNEAEKNLKEKRKEFVSRGADPNKLESYLVEYQAAVNNSLRRLSELVKLRDQVKEGAKNQMSLFGGLGSLDYLNETPIDLADGSYSGTIQAHYVTIWGKTFYSRYGIKSPFPQTMWFKVENGMVKFSNSDFNKKQIMAMANRQNQFDFIGVLGGLPNTSISGLGRVNRQNRKLDHSPIPTMEINGMGKIMIPSDAKAVASELKLKRSKKKFYDEPITSSLDVEIVVRKLFPQEIIEVQEAFYVLFTDTRAELVGYIQLGKGTVNSVEVDFRLLFAAGLQSLATGFLVVHNHPSGNTRPSDADIRLSRTLEQAGRLLQMKLLGSFIITKDEFVEINY